ncbi:MAG: DUF1236 domain-containing protein [Hyphomicrobiales bacterium]|nr:DUF1236 domain-containing protein [Hyphomicrobiales bacterium]
MQTRSTLLIAACAAAAALSQPASAQTTTTTVTTIARQTTAMAITPLNIRSGPGPEYPVIGAIPTNGQAVIAGCVEGSLWCQISYNGTQGWAYSQYMTAMVEGRPLAVSEIRELPPVTYAAPPATTGTAVVRPTYSGNFIAPVATTAPLSIAPPPTVQTYIVQNPQPQVYLNGEVVEGAGLPPDVALAPVPDSDYQYAYVNGVPVLVEPATRRVRYIYR